MILYMIARHTNIAKIVSVILNDRIFFTAIRTSNLHGSPVHAPESRFELGNSRVPLNDRRRGPSDVSAPAAEAAGPVCTAAMESAPFSRPSLKAAKTLANGAGDPPEIAMFVLTPGWPAT